LNEAIGRRLHSKLVVGSDHAGSTNAIWGQCAGLLVLWAVLANNVIPACR